MPETAAQSPDLATDEGLRAACAMIGPRDTSEWVQDLARTIQMVRSASEEERAERAFQERLWEHNHVASPGQGQISVTRALDADDFRKWLATASAEPLPESREHRVRALTALYAGLQDRIRGYVDRIPHLKMFRVIAALYPEAMTTIADRHKVQELAKRMGAGRGLVTIEQHVWVRERLDGLLGEASRDAIPLAERMSLPWMLYERFVQESEPSPVPPLPEPPPPAPPSAVSYWWLNANPTMWDLEATPVGEMQTYTSHNEKGNKRQKYRYFQEVKPGDVIIGYVTSPQKEVVALCRITKGLHGTTEGESIEFEKTERLGNPIPYSTLQGHPELAECEPIVSNQGSLFRLTEVEFEIIRVLIDEANPPAPPPPKPYTKQMAMDGLFMTGQQFEDMLGALRERKNLVLQGAPGVGKTFVAKRLAYALIGLESPQQVEMIQFHQSYAYEDFIQGFRPTPKGNFDLKPGVFYQFCRRAQRDEAQRKPYVFIIDEINRGNLSKIFGELMLLIEADKRGKHYAIPLAYASDADDRFYIPDNLYFIGTMNTADRSLALVDYALRRRFRFITLRPEYKAKAFTAWLDATGVAPGLVQKIVERMDALNEAITKDTKNLGAGYQIGHSYFCPTGHGQPDEDWYRRVVESEIIPMIEEYWFDDDDRVKKLRSMLLA